MHTNANLALNGRRFGGNSIFYSILLERFSLIMSEKYHKSTRTMLLDLLLTFHTPGLSSSRYFKNSSVNRKDRVKRNSSCWTLKVEIYGESCYIIVFPE